MSLLSGLGGSTVLSWLLTPASARPWCSAPAQLLAHSSCSACSVSHFPACPAPLPSSGPRQSQAHRLLSQPPLLAASIGLRKGGHRKPTHSASAFKTRYKTWKRTPGRFLKQQQKDKSISPLARSSFILHFILHHQREKHSAKLKSGDPTGHLQLEGWGWMEVPARLTHSKRQSLFLLPCSPFPALSPRSTALSLPRSTQLCCSDPFSPPG